MAEISRFTDVETKAMRRAIDLARRAVGQTFPNPTVGCVIIDREGREIGSGFHSRAGEPHAEVEALNSIRNGNAEGATVFVTLEPCCHRGKTPPCTEALIKAKVAEVVIADKDPNPLVNGKGIRALRRAGIAVRTGLLKKVAADLNEGYFTYHLHNRPFITIKWAITLDGRTAADSGSSKWISNDSSRYYVHQLRSRSNAVMVGIGTVLTDNPWLNVRLPNYEGQQPSRVILDGHLKSPLRCNCLNLEQGGQPYIITTSLGMNESRVKKLNDAGATVLLAKGKRGMLDLADCFKKLHGAGIQSVLVEGGQQLQTAMFEEGLVDKVVAFIAPKIIGGGTRSNPIEGWGIQEMGRAIQLRDVKIELFDDDVCIEGYIKH